MFDLLISEFSKNKIQNIFLIILVSMTTIAVMLISSAQEYQESMYRPFEFLDGKDGLYLFNGWGGIEFEDSVVAEEYCMYYANVMLAGENGSTTVYVYPEWVWKYWHPRMEHGSWLNDSSEDVNVVVGYGTGENEVETVEVVTGGSSKKLVYGQEYDITTMDGSTHKIKVTGTSVKGTSIFGGSNSFSDSDVNYQEMYSAPPATTYIMMTETDARKLGLYLEASGTHFVVTREDATAQEKKLYSDAMKTSCSGAAYDLKDFMANGHILQDNQTQTYLPVLIVCVVMVILSTCAVSFVNAEKSRRKQTVFYLLGANFIQRTKICAGNVLGVILLSAALTAMMFWLPGVSLTEKLVVSPVYSVKYAVCFLAAYLFTGIFVYAVALCGQSPVESLRHS